MPEQIIIAGAVPTSQSAKEIMNALWDEIQTRYNFKSPNPFGADLLDGYENNFWVAQAGVRTIGSIAVIPFANKISELDLMYVTPDYRGKGIAQMLIKRALDFVKERADTHLRLRCGTPQPEAMRFYEKEGFYMIERFGRWIDDESALCFEKDLMEL
jgi:GNAT superfamily N-acetyltransferase